MFELNNIELDIDSNTPLYAIGVVAEMLDISVQTIRSYENEGLIIPFKKDSLHRLYSQNDIIRLKCIRTAITQKKFSISAIKTIYSLIPCWTIKQCSELERTNCEAFNEYQKPCWTCKHENNPCSDEKCRLCEVYRRHAHCDSIKESIKSGTIIS